MIGVACELFTLANVRLGGRMEKNRMKLGQLHETDKSKSSYLKQEHSHLTTVLET